jgi:DNA primase
VIPKETIDIIFDASRIEDVVGDFVTLKKRGVNLLGNCPFHNEKTPSFTVSPAKGIYKCFGCGKAGNAVNFIMDHEHYSYPEALRYLANKYNIEVPEETEVRSDEELRQKNERESLLIVSEFARKHFTENLLNTEEGKSIGLSYFKERGFRDDIIEKFQLGFSSSGRSNFSDAAIKNGYNPQYLIKSGLAVEREEQPGKYYDRFYERVMFPIHNLSGRVIAFGGRTLRTDKKIAKYINSPETDIYHKSNVLYGLWLAKKAIIADDNCFLVEGYTDVISFHQAGIENVAASSGTSLTVEQIKLIKRYTNNITILYDGDDAGIKASLRGINLILEEGMNVKVVLFSDGEDPDSFARKNSPDFVRDFIKNKAADFIVFKSNLLLKEASNDPIKRAELIKEIVNTISLIPDAIYRSVYVKECSAILDVPEQTLLNELNRLRRRKLVKESGDSDIEAALPQEAVVPVKQQQAVQTKGEHQERDLIRVLLNYGNEKISTALEDGTETTISVAEYIIETLREDKVTFENPLYYNIFNRFVAGVDSNNIPAEADFIVDPDTAISSACIDLISLPYELSEGWEKHQIFVQTEKDDLNRMVLGAIYSIKLNLVVKMLEQMQQDLKIEKPDEELFSLLEQQRDLIKVKQELSDQLGRIILR